MTLRSHLQKLVDSGGLLALSVPVSKTYEMAGILKELEPRPVMFSNVEESPFRIMGNLCCSKASFADYFNIPVKEIIPSLIQSIKERAPCPVVTDAPCQEVAIPDPDLDCLPILRHCALDGGNYITSGVFIARHPRFGQNVDFHRAMQFSKTEMSIRVVRGRHFDRFLEELGSLDVAVCVGVPPEVLVAAATSIELGVGALENAQAPTNRL